MRKYKIYSIIIILTCIIISSLIVVKGYQDFEKLKKSQKHLEEYKNAPKELLNPEIPTTTEHTIIGKLIIPSIGLEVWIREDTVNAYDSVYHYPESVMPGEPGDCGILGHRTRYSGPFQLIGNLKPGDTVIIEDMQTSKRYIYKVVSNGQDIRWDYKENPIRFSQTGKPRLMLITCYPPGRTDAAWITYCELVETH
ncbi:MAG TPA: class E sortase [Methanothermobacter sp.]|nr:conserved hypothetical protein [Methanothermobacter sp. MT-2]HHW04955.1 class E sortase [Methanothermobacter sp.]HOK73488.1 class E sortase [Methanothermobacter sp.]HOL69503.1 class E sortase [Methanothermobacter sp.]HPQ05038.1 class E sortase [Methanothermobacter sp.]